MGYFCNIPLGGTEKDYQVRLGRNMLYQVEQQVPHLPAEWSLQSGIQLTWPHEATDWAYMLDEVQACFARVAAEVSKREQLLIVTPDPEAVVTQLPPDAYHPNIHFLTCPTNDTWARDHGAIAITDTTGVTLLDFTFNGWGLKFPADKDNQITRRAIEAGALHGQYVNRLGFVLEGGSIESDGMGTLLTTSRCLLSPNRNGQLNKADIETYLKTNLFVQQVLWLDHGYLAGDDTDSHIDTLARFCAPDTIAYVQCQDPGDEHYTELRLMEEQLQTFRTLEGKPYRLVPLPLPEAIVEDGERLPATYANFLIMNDAVLYPTYRQPQLDVQAGDILQALFPEREIVPVDCRPLICQHGSLHCITMQYPAGVL